MVKVWPSEWGQVTNDLAIQVFGGAGYTRDVPVEQLFRDQRLNQIHEGTTGIQALDLVGRKLLRDRGEAFGLLVRRVEGAASKAREFPALVALADRLDDSWSEMKAAVAHLLKNSESGPILGNATPFLWAMGHAVVAWIWLELATTVMHGKNEILNPFQKGKLHACQYFMEAELPKIATWLAFSISSEVTALHVSGAVLTEIGDQNLCNSCNIDKWPANAPTLLSLRHRQPLSTVLPAEWQPQRFPPWKIPVDRRPQSDDAHCSR